MKSIRLITFATIILLTFGACSKQDESETSQPGSELLAYVPADTPYVVANLETVPDELIDAYLERLQPVLDTMQSRLSAAREKLESDQTDPDDPGLRLAHALLMEFDGKLSRSGLESLGFDMGSKRVLYGMGAFPVIRLGLSNPETLRSTILRVMENAGITAPEQEFQGVAFWRLSDPGHTDVDMGFYVSVLEDHLAMGLLPTTAEAELLPAFLGLESPAGNEVQTRLQKLNRDNGYTGYGSGILDLRQLADQFLDPTTLTGQTLAASGEWEQTALAPECVAEIHEVIANFPVMTLGIKELSDSAIAMQYRVETPDTLASRLVGLVSEIPAADTQTSRLLELAFGMRFGPVRDFLREKAAAIVNDPYQCEYFVELNENAAEALEQLDQPMPPFLNNFRGLRVSLSDFVLGQDPMPANARGYVAVHVEQPQMFVGMAQMFLPDLSSLPLAPGEPPVRLPEGLVPVVGLTAFAAMSDSAIGLSLGEGEEDGLTDFLDRKAGPEGTFLSASYDMAAYLDYSKNLSDRYQLSVDTDYGDSTGHEEFATDFQEATARALKAMADRSSTSMSFTSEGLVIENRMTFKP